MNAIDQRMVDTYYLLIKSDRRSLEDIPEQVPQEVKDAVQNLLAQDQGVS